MFASLLLVATTHRAPLALLHHLSEQLAILSLIGMICSAMLAMMTVEAMFTLGAINSATTLSAGMGGLEVPLAMVNSVRSNCSISLKAVILLAGLMGIVFLVDAAAALVVEAATGNLVGAGFLDLMGSVSVEGVHRLILAAALWLLLCRTYRSTPPDNSSHRQISAPLPGDFAGHLSTEPYAEWLPSSLT
jgi:hypothetical protein